MPDEASIPGPTHSISCFFWFSRIQNKPEVALQDLDEQDLEASFEQYCQDIQETAAWGGQTELNALANVLHQHIKVYAAGLPVVDMGQQYQGSSLYRLCQNYHCLTHWMQ